jgi:hypothetical protein
METLHPERQSVPLADGARTDEEATGTRDLACVARYKHKTLV